MDSHPKKKEKLVQSKLEINPRSRCWQRKPNTVHTKQKQTKPHYPILQYRFVYKKKKPNTEKTKPQTQSKPNPRWDVDGHVACRRSSLRRSSSLSSCRRLVACPPLVVACREGSSQIVVDRRSQIGTRLLRCSPLGLKVFLSLFLSHSLSLSFSLKWKIWMWEYCLMSL